MNVIIIRLLIQLAPLSFWVTSELFHQDRIVATGIGETVQTIAIMERYNLFSMLLSFIVSGFVTGWNQVLLGRTGVGGLWIFFSFICSSMIYSVLTAKIGDKYGIYKFQQYLLSHKIKIFVVITLLIIGSETLPALF